MRVVTVMVARSPAIGAVRFTCAPVLRVLALGAVTGVLYVVSLISLIDRFAVFGAAALGGGVATVLALRLIDLSPRQIFKVARLRPRMQLTSGDEQHAEA